MMNRIDSFESKYEPTTESGCWLWLGTTKPYGYGNFAYMGESWRAHRFSYEHFKGPITKGLEVDHLCRVRSCVNPDHLEAVTHLENVRRGRADYNKHKTHCPKGHPYNVENTRIYKGWRKCRTCHREGMRKGKL